jgi:sRNA-binding protein
MSKRHIIARSRIATATLAVLMETWPKCFVLVPDDRRPLRIGIDRDIMAAADGAITPAELDAALASYTACIGYWRGLREGRPRIGLDGFPFGRVTADEASFARQKIERVRDRSSARVRARGLALAAAKRKADSAREATKSTGFAALRAAAAARAKLPSV